MKLESPVSRHLYQCGAERGRMTGGPGKAEQTRRAIVECALGMACARGLGSLTLGTVADRMGLSKTGVFARVGSIEALQLHVLAAYRTRFDRQVAAPARAAPAGTARLRAMFAYWARQVGEEGCLYLSCASEFAHRPGPLRDAVLADVLAWRLGLEHCARQAVDGGQLAAATDVRQLACDMSGLVLALHHDVRLLGAGDGAGRSMRAFERLLAACAGAAGARPPPFSLVSLDDDSGRCHNHNRRMFPAIEGVMHHDRN